ATIRTLGPLGAVLDVLSESFLTMLAALWPDDPKVRLHDPLTVATVVDPSLGTFEEARVGCRGGPGACRTVEWPGGRTVDACRTADNARLTELLLTTLRSTPGVSDAS